ncbi:unnamed protein product [Phyllotreta striolata]|uniref:Sodium channel protein Nach-like n=1 Tax=Phyllotreta striolata TaxID=444603 RepID=A0A9N9XK15_PHYSR|nr:unnamed protein product [Phyllotreta striolata]
MMTSIVLIATVLYNDEQNPLILVTETTQNPIWNYDFPAITICENNKISKKKANAFARHLAKHNESLNAETLKKQLRYLYYLIDTLNVNDEIAEELFNLQRILDHHNYTAHSVLRRLGNSCDDITIKCIWSGLTKKCSNIIKQVRTTQGYCCSFNNFVFANATPSTGFISDKEPNAPFRTSSCGYHSGLILLIDNDIDDYYASSVPTLGHRIQIHDPYSFPDRNSRNSFSPASVLNVLSIFAQSTHSSEEVRKIPVKIRQCLFPDERKLHYFTRYTFANCLVEARMNLTKRICNCTPFFYFRQIDSPDLRVCNLIDVPCLSKIESKY